MSKLYLFQADEHVINKAFQDRNVERAAMKNKSGSVSDESLSL